VNGDYLWDGSGEPDPQIARLEAALRPLRRVPPAPELPAHRPGLTIPPLSDWRALAAAAAVLLALASALLPSRASGPGWDLVWLADGGGSDPGRKLREGEWLETGQRRARLEVGEIGVVRLEPLTRVSVLDVGREAHRLSLAHGTLHATIWAPPGRFFVETKAARAVDLGCEYTLEVAGDGSGVLRVEAGWVGFEHGGVQSLVPAGAWCRTRPGRGPGTPRFDTAPPAFAAALDVIDAGGSPEVRRDALDRALAEVRERDALSLWHLLARLEPEGRGRVFDRLAQLVPPPEGVTRDGVVAGDRAMRDLWWDELGFGSSDFWRLWTRSTTALTQGR
jgi:hypothetical protein